MRAVSKETNQCRRLTQPFISVNKDNRSVGNSGFSNILSSRSTWAMRLMRGEHWDGDEDRDEDTDRGIDRRTDDYPDTLKKGKLQLLFFKIFRR